MMIDVIIPNYNGSRLLEKNLPRVIEAISKYRGSGIIIVDDASEESELQAVKEIVSRIKSQRIRLLENKKNLGFSSTVNRGAFASRADFLVFLNTDVAPQKDFLDPVLQDFENNKDLFGVGLLDKSIEGGKVTARGRGIGKWSRGFFVHSRGEVDKRNTLWISGGSSVVRRELFEKFEGFDELFNPFYWEDIDLSYRVQKAGYNILFEKDSIVTHEHEKGAILSHYSASDIKTISYRNQLIFIWKNITDASLILSHIAWLPYHIFRAIIKGDREFLRGFFLALLLLPVIIKKRVAQKSPTLSDRDILSQFHT